jgi:hydroxyacylglutathione hydrolase
MEIKHLALGMVNAYLVKTATGLFLIDTGIAMGRSKLELALAQEGVSPGDIRLVIATHGDLDHIGNCAYLQKKYGLKIAVHEGDADLCRTGKTNFNRKRKESVFAKIKRSFIHTFVFKPIMKKYPLEPFEPDIILSDGQDLTDLGFNAKIVYIPGHSRGSIGILTADGDFFCGDTFNNRKEPEVANIVENEAELAASLEKIRSLSIKNVYPGHGIPFAMSDFMF